MNGLGKRDLSIELTYAGLAATGPPPPAGPNPLGPPAPVSCWRCRQRLRQCTCQDAWLAGLAAARAAS